MKEEAQPQPTAYPLTWPVGWKRTTYRSRSRFKCTLTKALNDLEREVRLLGASGLVVSTNLQRRLDGRPYSSEDKRANVDPGVAVYFTLKSKPIALACDKWITVAANVEAIAKHINAIRGQDRWGVGTIEQAFAGYTALPAHAGPDGHENWRDVLGIQANQSLETVRHRFRLLAREAHPDKPGGSEAAMRRLNAAMAAAEKELTR